MAARYPTASKTLLACLVLLAACQLSIGTNYVIQAFLPITGPNAARYQQWASAMRASAATASSTLSPDSVSVDIYDYAGDLQLLGSIGSKAMSNASVIAVVGDEVAANVFSPFAAASSLPLLSPFDSGNRAGLTSYSLQTPYYGVQTLAALCSQYSWKRIAFVFSADATGYAWRDKIISLPGFNVTQLEIAPDAPATDIQNAVEALQRLSLNIIVVSLSDQTILTQLFTYAQHSRLLSPGRAWINLALPYQPTPAIPQGAIVINPVEGTQANRTAFENLLHSLSPSLYPGTGPGTTVQTGSLLAYDAVQVISSAIAHASPRSRANVISQLSTRSFDGFSGTLSFSATNGSRLSQYAELLFANATSTGYNLTMQYDGASLTTFETPLFPGATTSVPDDQMDFIPVATIWALTSNVFPPASVPWAINTAFYTADWINNQTGLLPARTKLSMSLYDDQSQPALSVKHALTAIRTGAVAVFGGMTPALAISMQGALAAYDVPHVSTAITSAVLSNKLLYPTFMRLVPSSDPEGIATISMAVQFGWTDVTFVSSSDTAGTSVTQVALSEAAARGVNVEHHFLITPGLKDYDEVAQQIKATKPAPRILIFFVSYDSTVQLWQSLHRVGVPIVAAIVVDTFPPNVPLSTYAAGVPASFFEGWLLVSPPAGTGQLYRDFVASVSQLPWNEYPGVSVISPVIPAAFDAISVLASAIKTLKESGGDPRNGTQLLDTMLAFSGVLLTGSVAFTPEGDRTPQFDLKNIIQSVQTTVGRWTPENGLQLLPSVSVVWPDGTNTVPVSTLPRHMNWLAWNSGAGIALAIVAMVGLLLSLIVVGFFFYFRTSPVIKSSTSEFMILMLVGVMLGFGSALVWIGRPTDWICALRIWIPPVAFLLILAPLIAKTWRLHRIFSLADLGITPITLSTLVMIVTVLVSLQVIICIFWISLGTIKPTIINDPTDRTQAFVLCGSSKVNRICSYVTYGYIGSIIAVGSYLAFRVRKLPKDFNESKWIARSIYNIFLFAGLIIILGYALSKYYIVVLVLIVVCTLAICYGSLALMMAPKLWTLYKHPKKRSSAGGNSQSREMKNTKSGSHRGPV